MVSGSDHFPIAIYCNRASTFETNSSWKLSKANWKAFSDKAASDLKCESVRDPDDPVGKFTNNLINIANHSIPKSKLKVVKHNTIWFNDECKEARKIRRKPPKLHKRREL